MTDQTQKPTLKQFYFNSSWYSLFTTSYLFLFFYFAVAYLDNVFSAIGFVFRTLTTTTTLIPITNILWSAVYVISLLIPFTVSLIAIFSLPRIWQRTQWKKDQRLLATVILTVIIFLVMLIAGDLVETIGKMDVLIPFL